MTTHLRVLCTATMMQPLVWSMQRKETGSPTNTDCSQSLPSADYIEWEGREESMQLLVSLYYVQCDVNIAVRGDYR